MPSHVQEICSRNVSTVDEKGDVSARQLRNCRLGAPRYRELGEVFADRKWNSFQSGGIVQWAAV